MKFSARSCLALAGLLLGCALAGPAQAQPAARASAPAPGADCPPEPRLPTAEERAAGAAHARDRGFLWRIRKGGRSSWLYGTIHIARRDWMFPGPRVMAAVRASDVVAFELDITDGALMQRLQAGLADGAKQPVAPVPDDLAARLRAQLRAACAPPGMLDAMSPEMVGAMLMMMSVRRDGLDASYGIDPALAHVARREHKAVVSLETPEQQLRLMQSGSAGELREGLEKILRDLEQDRARPMLLRVAGVWAQGRADELARYREWCDCANTAYERATLKAMLDDRNGPMAARIDALHSSGKTVFAAVGSLHMFGPAALPALMAARGYRVERVVFGAP
ncbi:MAG: TraB/GumN family protein [Rhizobacter sp.]|nr:TraB/GumN family protein [Rhizobacter sp.]